MVQNCDSALNGLSGILIGSCKT